MSEFTVKLLPSAEDDLAAHWMATPDPAEVTRADDTADRLLRRDPLGNGTHVSEGLYRLTVEPLVYYYTVDEAARTVEVSYIREVRR